MSMRDASHIDDRLSQSVEPSALAGLSRAQKERLSSILDDYLRALENGFPPSPEEVIAAHPDLAAPLESYLASLAELHDVAATFGGNLPQSEQPQQEAEDSERRLGDFELLREVGRGGMGVVYEARQISLGRRVALKVLPFAAVLDRRQIARFKNEAQAAAQLHHPNIVPVFAVGVERGVHYYAMQFIDGQPLDEAIADMRRQRDPSARTETGGTTTTQNALDDETESPSDAPRHGTRSGKPRTPGPEYFREVIRLGIQAAEALHAAHSDGIVHRDVKPSNLLLDAEGKLWITDFGLARCQTDAALTQTGDIVGTRQYMSPEQALGQHALVDQRTDIYSLGVTLYEMLTLRPAADGTSTTTQPARSPRHEPVRPRTLQPQLPADLETVVLKAMAYERDERYLTAQLLADDLQRVLEGQPTVARPPTLVDRLSKYARRHRRVVAAAAAACLAAIIALSAGILLVNRERTKAEQSFARAEDYFKQAQGTVDKFGSQFAGRLAEVPGAESVRRELLADTLEYYETFVEQAGDDPALRAELATTQGKIGALNDQLGLRDEAIDAHRKAIAMLEGLVAAQPEVDDYRRRLAVCRNNLGLTLSRAGRFEEALDQLQQAIAAQQQLVSEQAQADGLHSELAVSFVNLGDLQRQQGADDAAEASLREAIRLQEQLAETARRGDGTGNVEWLRNLAATYNQLAALAGQDPADAVGWYEKAVAYQRQALEAQPEGLRHKSDLATWLNNLAAARARTGDLEKAAATYSEAIDLQQDLLRIAPLDRAYRRDLAVSYNNLGLAHTRLRDPENAQRCFRNALGFHRQLVAERPLDLDVQSSLGGVYNNLGIVLEQTGQDTEAAEAYAEAIAHQRIAQENAPGVPRYREFLSKHYFNRGRVLRRLDRPDEAVEAAMARKRLWPDEPQRLLSVAEEIALCGAKTPSEGQLTAEQCTQLALATLRAAVAAGLSLPEDLARREAFANIKEHPDFAELVSDSQQQ
ncbi:MAG: serine/threonine protein kinase [Planctomycetota bacterium]|nr:MAG: serine/threonine protein kinase [Planctomycetota bacterium]